MTRLVDVFAWDLSHSGALKGPIKVLTNPFQQSMIGRVGHCQIQTVMSLVNLLCNRTRILIFRMCWNYRRKQDAGKLEDAQMPQMRKGDGTDPSNH